MKRAEWLIPLSHDHQHGLAQSLRLRRAAQSNEAATLRQHVGDMLAFMAGELADHMSREESELLPAVDRLGCLRAAEVERVASEHLHIRTLGAKLADSPEDAALALELADSLRDHIRWEERELFEQLQERLSQVDPDQAAGILNEISTDETLAIAEPRPEPGAVGIALGSLNATAVHIAPTKALEEATIDRDVVFVITAGAGQLISTYDGETSTTSLTAGRVVALCRGSQRRLVAGDQGLQFASVHVRRGALTIS